MTDTHKFVGTHLDDLHDGRILEPGKTVRLDQRAVEHPHNQRLIAEGKLIELPKRSGGRTTGGGS